MDLKGKKIRITLSEGLEYRIMIQAQSSKRNKKSLEQ